MAIKKSNKRVQITLSYEVIKKLNEVSNELGVSKSNAVAFLVNKEHSKLKEMEDIRA